MTKQLVLIFAVLLLVPVVQAQDTAMTTSTQGAVYTTIGVDNTVLPIAKASIRSGRYYGYRRGGVRPYGFYPYGTRPYAFPPYGFRFYHGFGPRPYPYGVYPYGRGVRPWNFTQQRRYPGWGYPWYYRRW